MLPLDYMAHALLVQGNSSQLTETIGHSGHLEHLFKCNMLVNLNYQSEGKHHTAHTALEKQEQEIASKATGTLFTHLSFNRQCKSKGECLFIYCLMCVCFNKYCSFCITPFVLSSKH